MSEIRRFPILPDLRSEPSTHLLVYRNGTLRKSGQGLSLWFLPLSTGIAEIPIDDREMQFIFHGRSADFQDVAVQGVITRARHLADTGDIVQIAFFSTFK